MLYWPTRYIDNGLHFIEEVRAETETEAQSKLEGRGLDEKLDDCMPSTVSTYVSAIEHLRAGRYAECLHTTCQLYNLTNDNQACRNAFRDSGLIHEIAHLSSNIETTRQLADIEAELRELEFNVRGIF